MVKYIKFKVINAGQLGGPRPSMSILKIPIKGSVKQCKGGKRNGILY